MRRLPLVVSLAAPVALRAHDATPTTAEDAAAVRGTDLTPLLRYQSTNTPKVFPVQVGTPAP